MNIILFLYNSLTTAHCVLSPVNGNFDFSRGYYYYYYYYYDYRHYINFPTLYFVCKVFVVSFQLLVLTLAPGLFNLHAYKQKVN
jgi:hypothetical protein